MKIETARHHKLLKQESSDSLAVWFFRLQMKMFAKEITSEQVKPKALYFKAKERALVRAPNKEKARMEFPLVAACSRPPAF